MANLSQEQINIDLFDEVNRLKAENKMLREREINVKALLLRANECYVTNQDLLVNVNIIKALGELGVIK